jgi:hypothetical protein
MKQREIVTVVRHHDALLACGDEEVFGIVTTFPPDLACAHREVSTQAEQRPKRIADVVIEVEIRH